jgi:hypothetical protein
VTTALFDDHLLRDLLSDQISGELANVLELHEPATTNLYYLRLCKSVVSARGGQLTGAWPEAQRRDLGRALIALPDRVEIVPVRTLAFRMAVIAGAQRLSTLGAEAVAAAEHLDAPLCVWNGDDGPGIRTAIAAIGGSYLTVSR